MWGSGDWPSALGLGISSLNVESEYVPGKDAAYVKAETDKIIQQAAKTLCREGAVHWPRKPGTMAPLRVFDDRTAGGQYLKFWMEPAAGAAALASREIFLFFHLKY